jgi:hypothetical protein
MWRWKSERGHGTGFVFLSAQEALRGVIDDVDWLRDVVGFMDERWYCLEHLHAYRVEWTNPRTGLPQHTLYWIDRAEAVGAMGDDEIQETSE